MKDSEIPRARSEAEEAEKFQALFAEQREVIENRLLTASTLPQDTLQDFFAEMNSSLQTLQRLYSASSPYLRIYYRKVYQDALQALATRIQETEAKCIPRKKFVFKGNRGKGKPQAVVSNGSNKVKGEAILATTDELDSHSGGSCIQRDKVDTEIVLSSNDVTGKAVLLSKLRNCRVRMEGAPTTVHIADVTDSIISCGPVTTSVFVESVASTTFHLACQQLRIHETTNCDFFIHVTSKAIIEDCRKVRFGIYDFNYPSRDEDYKLSGLNRNVNNWREIDDFNWLVAGQPSPNWSLIEDVSS